METNGTNDTRDLRPRHIAGCNPGDTHSTSAAATSAALVEGSAVGHEQRDSGEALFNLGVDDLAHGRKDSYAAQIVTHESCQAEQLIGRSNHTNPSSAHDGNEAAAAAAAAKAKALRQKNLAAAQQAAKVTRQLTKVELERFTNFNNLLEALDLEPLPQDALNEINNMRYKTERTGHTFEQYAIDTNYQGSQLEYIKQKFPTDAEIVEIFCSAPFLISKLKKELTDRGIQVELPKSLRLNLAEFNLIQYQLFISNQDYCKLLRIDLPTYPEPEPENHLLQQTQSDRPNIAPSTTACWHRQPQNYMEKIIYDWVHEEGITPEDTDCRKALANKIIPKEDHLEPDFDIFVRDLHPSFPYLTSLPISLRTKQIIVLDGFTALKSLPEGLKCMSLDLKNCSSLEKLPEDLGVSLCLLIRNCPLLKTLPNSLALRSLDIEDCPSLEKLPNSLKAKTVAIRGKNVGIPLKSIQSYKSEPDFVTPTFKFLKESKN